MLTRRCNINPHILRYLEAVEKDAVPVCKEQKQLAALVRRAFAEEDIWCDDARLERYLTLQKFFPYRLFDWETFCFALHNCVFRADGMPRWPDLFICVGRGAGKNGYLAFEDFALLSHYHGIMRYDIDICANAEDQARTTFDDIYDILEENRPKLERFFYWNKEKIVNLKTKSVLRFRTSNARTKDGGRQGKVDFDEVHEYEDYAILDVFTTGLGKKPHPRRTFITTNGKVRDGVLDDYLAQAAEVLAGNMPDGGMLFFICRLDDKQEVHDERLWVKANPSLPFRPDLLEEMRKEYADFQRGRKMTGAFMTKRMNTPESDVETAVTDFENLRAASRPVPLEMLEGRKAVVGIDFTKVNDFATAGFLLRDGDMRYWIDHTWVCRHSKDLGRIKAPLDEWAAQGLLTWVDDVEIDPEWVVEWIVKTGTEYNLRQIALDNFRYSVFASALRKIGFSAKEHKNVKLVGGRDVMKVHPVIESMFLRQRIAWGDPTMMRWYVNNTKSVPAARRAAGETDLGNWTYGKIEGKSRKTDGFMALVAAMTVENELDEAPAGNINSLPVLAF